MDAFTGQTSTRPHRGEGGENNGKMFNMPSTLLLPNALVAESTDPAILDRPTWSMKLSNMAVGPENCPTRN